MKTFTVEVTKVIVKVIKADSYVEATQLAETDAYNGDDACSWDRAEPQYKLLDECND